MPQPNKIPRPFADSGDKNSIPDSSGSIGFASWQEGFPAITSEPFASGGVAPKRADFNGIFNALSAATVWNQQGGVYAYDNATDYEVGNVVLYSGNLYKCITANGPSSAVKAPSDTTVWDAIATASGYLPLSGGSIANSNESVDLRPGLIEITANVPFIDFHHALSQLDFTARIINDTSGRLLFTIKNDENTQTKNLSLSSSGTLTWDGKDVVRAESSASGKMKLSDGTMIQWGKKASSTSAVQSVTFGEAFYDNNVEISIQFLSGPLTSVNNDGRSVLTSDLTKTGFKFTAVGITSNTVVPVVGNCSWIAIGRWKA